jgi:hypothetical protein
MTCSPRRIHEHIISTTTPNSLPPNLSSNSTAHLNTLLLLFSPQSTHHCNIYLDVFTVTEFNYIFSDWQPEKDSSDHFWNSLHIPCSLHQGKIQSIKASLISVSKKHHVISCFHWLWEFKQSLLSSSLLLCKGKCPYTSWTPKIDCCLHINPTHNQSDISCIFTSYHHATHYGQSHYLPQGTEVTNNTNFSQDSPWKVKPYMVTCVKCLNMNFTLTHITVPIHVPVQGIFRKSLHLFFPGSHWYKVKFSELPILYLLVRLWVQMVSTLLSVYELL